MTDTRDLERELDPVLAAWLRPGPVDAPPRLLAAIDDAVARTTQRRGPRAWLQTRTPRLGATLAAAAAGVVLVAAATAWLAGGGLGPVVGGPSPTMLAPTATPAGPTPVPTSAPGSPEAGGDLVTLTASNFAWDTGDLYVPADMVVVVRLVNADDSVPHNLQVIDESGRVVFTSDIAVGPDTRLVSLPAMAAGTYTFMDQVHPNMVGTLHVGMAPPSPPLSPEPSETPPPADVVLTVSAAGFDPSPATFAGGRRFWIELDNVDAGVRHGLEILDAAGTVILDIPFLRPLGPGSARYPVDALPAGTYTIRDPLHPELRAVLLVGS